MGRAGIATSGFFRTLRDDQPLPSECERKTRRWWGGAIQSGWRRQPRRSGGGSRVRQREQHDCSEPTSSSIRGRPVLEGIRVVK